MQNWKAGAIGLVWAGCVSAAAFAAPAPDAAALLAQAEAHWQKRGDPAETLKALELYEQAASQDRNNFEVRIQAAHAAYWWAEQQPESPAKEQIAVLRRGVKAAEEILSQDPRHPQANYWHMYDLAAITVAEGILRGGYAFKEAIVGTIFIGSGDMNYCYGGIFSYWARVIYTMPGFLGRFFHFTGNDAVWLYQQALGVEPNYFKTRFQMAESYEKMDRHELAQKEYQYLVSTSPNILPAAAPENAFYQELARKKLQK